MKAKKEIRYVSRLTVHTLSASALIDMMRYDCCYPATEEESRKIWALIGNEQCGNRDEPKNHIVQLTRVARTDLPATVDRWRSFGCLVLDERPAGDAPLTDEQAARLLVEHGGRR